MKQIYIFGMLMLIILFSCGKVFEGLTNRSLVDIRITGEIPSCKDFCGPSARCAVSGTDCTEDLDCKGCATTRLSDMPPTYYKGTNTWRDAFDLGHSLSDFKDDKSNYLLRPTLSGEFITREPEALLSTPL